MNTCDKTPERQIRIDVEPVACVSVRARARVHVSERVGLPPKCIISPCVPVTHAVCAQAACGSWCCASLAAARTHVFPSVQRHAAHVRVDRPHVCVCLCVS